MHTINSRDIIAFKHLSDVIHSSNSIIPIHSYVGIVFSDNSVHMTKFGNNGAITYKCAGEVMPFFACLIDQRVLFQFAEANEGDIQIIPDEKIIRLQCGKSKAKSPTEPFGNFLQFPVPDANGYPMPSSLLDELKIAGQFIDEHQAPTRSDFVFIGNGMIAGGNGHIFYFTPCEGVDKMVLRRQTILGISQFKQCDHSSNDRYDFFSDGKTTIAFLKSELLYSDFSHFIKAPNTESFTIKKTDLMAFNTWAAASTPKNYMIASWLTTDEGLSLSAQDADYNIECNRLIPCRSIAAKREAFTYNVDLMNRALKALPADDLIFYAAGKDKYYIKDTLGTFTAIVLGIQEQPKN